jgi:hypothetical protein
MRMFPTKAAATDRDSAGVWQQAERGGKLTVPGTIQVIAVVRFAPLGI